MPKFKKITQKIAVTCTIAIFCLGCTETTNDNTVAGLKEALTVGVNSAVTSLSIPGGYLNDQAVKILLPEEAQNVFKVYNAINSYPFAGYLLSQVGMPANFETTLVTLINTAAEDAAPQATNIFVGAITGITIMDGQSILFGADNAATTYLHDKTYGRLQTTFEPSITASLNTVTVGSYTPVSAWEKLAGINNSLVNIVNGNALAQTALLFAGVQINTMETNLSNYVTGKALNGLFTKIADQEFKIRTDINARTSDLLRDVFGRLDK